ncbi:hypothetical protein AURDEDRAFT_140794, partial [Auricularia subglabra TFB-10046 SS5]
AIRSTCGCAGTDTEAPTLTKEHCTTGCSRPSTKALLTPVSTPRLVHKRVLQVRGTIRSTCGCTSTDSCAPTPKRPGEFAEYAHRRDSKQSVVRARTKHV